MHDPSGEDIFIVKFKTIGLTFSKKAAKASTINTSCNFQVRRDNGI
jgi:hypothetical protein